MSTPVPDEEKLPNLAHILGGRKLNKLNGEFVEWNNLCPVPPRPQLAFDIEKKGGGGEFYKILEDVLAKEKCKPKNNSLRK